MFRGGILPLEHDVEVRVDLILEDVVPVNRRVVVVVILHVRRGVPLMPLVPLPCGDSVWTPDHDVLVLQVFVLVQEGVVIVEFSLRRGAAAGKGVVLLRPGRDTKTRTVFN